MKELTQHSDNHNSVDCLIASSYIEYHNQIVGFIKLRINNVDDADDLAHDAFVRLLDYKQMLRPETVKSFIFTIVRNLVIDYIRRQYRKQEVSANMYEFSKDFSYNMESQIHANDIMEFEKLTIVKLPKQRKQVYMMDRFEEKSAEEISNELQISKRTVESHLFNSRKTVRENLKECI